MTYRCERCGGVFEETRSDDEAQAEAAAKWPTVPMEDMAEVCDDCYQLLMRRH